MLVTRLPCWGQVTNWSSIIFIKTCINDELEALKSNDLHVATELVQTEIKVATLETDNKALKSDIENLNLKNNIAELEIQKLKSQVEDLETANAELTSSINNLEGTFDPLVESIEIIEEDMENLMIWQNGTEEVIIELQVYIFYGDECWWRISDKSWMVTDLTIFVTDIHDLFACSNIRRIIFLGKYRSCRRFQW